MYRIKYSILQMLYWSTVGVLLGYMVSFLQANGFSNGEIGIVSSVEDIVALCSALIISTQIDRDRLPLRLAGFSVLLIQAIALLFLITKPGYGLMTAFCALFASAGCLVINPLYIKLALDITASGEKLLFGTSRGFGSLAFAVGAWFMGFAAERWTLRLMPVIGIVLLALQGILFLSLSSKYSHAISGEQSEVKHTSLSSLLKKKGFVVFLIGLALIFAANNSINNYMINIVREVGGNYANLGQMSFVLALTEFPAMLYYSRKGTSSCKRFLSLSLFFFPVKLFAIAMARSVPGLFAAILLQSISFGLYTPAVVDYIDKSVPQEFSAKAQSLAAMMPSLGTIVVTPISGVLLDSFSVFLVLIILSTLATAGALVGIWGIKRSDKYESRKSVI